MLGQPTGHELVEALREQMRGLEATQRTPRPSVTSGCSALDGLLPSGGFCRGTLVEWLAGARGSGAETLAMIAAREAARDGGAIVVLDAPGEFYPPAAAALGVDLNQVMIVRAKGVQEEVWAWDQALRCPAVAAVWGSVQRLDAHAHRRLQLAAESGGALGLLLRPEDVRGLPTWSAVQLLVEPRPAGEGRRLRVEVVRCRGGGRGGFVELQLDEAIGTVSEACRHETHSLHLAAQLADSAAAGPRTGASAS